MVNDNAFSNNVKNDFTMDENSTIGALQNMNFIIQEALDGYDKIDFSLLDDGYSEIPEENTYILQDQSTEDAAQEAIFETTVPFEEMKKSDLFLHDEIVNALDSVFRYNRRLVQEIADGFYDLEAEHNGLVKLWNLREIRRKNVVVHSDKPLVDALLGTYNNNDTIQNAHYSNAFIPILYEKRRTFIDVTEDEKFVTTRDGILYKPTIIASSEIDSPPPFTKVENYGTLREHVKEGEDNAFVQNDNAGMHVTFSDNRIFKNMLFDTDVFLVNSYEAYNSLGNTHRFSNGIKRLINEPSSSRNSIVFQKDTMVETEQKNVIGFVQKGKKSKNTKEYEINFQKLEEIDRKHKGNNVFLFSDVSDVQKYAKMLDYIVPSLSELSQDANNLSKLSKNIRKYDYKITDIVPSLFKNLQEQFSKALNKQYKNKFLKINYSVLSPSLISSFEETILYNNERLAFLENYYGSYKKEYKNHDNSLMRFAWLLSKSDNGSLLVDINSDKRRREIVSLNARDQQKKYSLFSKYFITQKQSIRDKIMSSTNDEVQQKELFKRYLISHGNVSKMSHSVVDGQGNFICCTHLYDLLMEDTDTEGILINYGIRHHGTYSCKYCGEYLHTDYDEGPSFDDDGNVIVTHGEIEIEENTESALVLDDKTSMFMNTFLDVLLKAISVKYSNMAVNKTFLIEMFLKNMKIHVQSKNELENIFSIDNVKDELNKEKENTVKALRFAAAKKGTKLADNIAEKVRIEVNTTYITSMVCYKVGVLVSVIMLQLQLRNPQLFGDETAYITSFSNILNQEMVINAISEYTKENSVEKLSSKTSYQDFVTKKNVVPVKPFASVLRQTKNINILRSVMEDNYKRLLETEKVDIILAKHKLKNSNVNVMQREIDHYGSVRVPHKTLSYKDNINDIQVLASDYVGLVDSGYKQLLQTNDYNASLRLTVDISSKLKNNEPRKKFDLYKFGYETNEVLQGVAENIQTAKKELDTKSKKYKTTFVKNVRNDVVPSVVNPALTNKGVLKPRLLTRRILVNKEEPQECNSIQSNIETIVNFIVQNTPLDKEEVKDLEFVKYWYTNSVFNAKLFEKLYSDTLTRLSTKKVSEFEEEIVFSDMLKNRNYSEYYLDHMYKEVDNTIKISTMSFLQNYLRRYTVLYAVYEPTEEQDGEEEQDEEKPITEKDIIFSELFRNYKTLEKEQNETSLCLMLREIVYNIETLNEIAGKYALILLKLSYEITLNMNSKNITRKEIDVIETETRRKQYVNMKVAKERGVAEGEARVTAEGAEGAERQEREEREEREEIQQIENTDDIPVDIVEESEGNY